MSVVYSQARCPYRNHIKDEELIMTHFCGAQPLASPFDSEPKMQNRVDIVHY